MSRILGTYRILYVVPYITNVKNLIDHDDYLNIVKPALDQIHELEKNKKFKEAGEIKRKIKDDFGDEWFTNKSPLFEAIETCLLILPASQGEFHPVIIDRIL